MIRKRLEDKHVHYYSSNSIAYLEWTSLQVERLNILFGSMYPCPTKTEIAEKIGELGVEYKRGYIENLFNGKAKQVRPELIEAICEAYHINILSIFDGLIGK